MKSRIKIFYLAVILTLGGFVNLFAQVELTTDQMLGNLQHMTFKVDSLQKKVRMLNEDMQQWIKENPKMAEINEARFTQHLDDQIEHMLTGMRGSFNQIHFLLKNREAMNNRQVKRNIQDFQMNMLDLTGKMDDVVLSMERMHKGMQAKKLSER